MNYRKMIVELWFPFLISSEDTFYLKIIFTLCVEVAKISYGSEENILLL